MSLRIALAQCDATLGDLAGNVEAHRTWIARAREAGASLLVFPELSLTGYLLQDIVPEVSVRRDDPLFAALGREAGGMALALSGIEESDDHGQYIASFLVENDAVCHVHRKVYLANYGVFDEARYVGPGRHIRCADASFGKVGLMLCEDAWHPSLVSVMLLGGADLLVIQVASPVRDLTRGELPGNARTWMETLRTYARLYGTTIAFCNRVGSEDGLVFWGHSCVIGPDGEMIAAGPLYDEDLVIADVDPERAREARLSNPVLREEKVDVTVRELTRLLAREGEQA